MEKRRIKNITGSDQTRKHNLVTVMFIIVFIFLICNLAEPLFFLYRVVFNMQKRPDTCFFMVTINASVNAVVYGIFSQNYRKTLLKLIWRIPQHKTPLEDPQETMKSPK